MSTTTIKASDANKVSNDNTIYLNQWFRNNGFIFIKQREALLDNNVHYTDYYEFSKDDIKVRTYTSGRVLIYNEDLESGDFPIITFLFNGYFSDPKTFEYILPLIKTKG